MKANLYTKTLIFRLRERGMQWNQVAHTLGISPQMVNHYKRRSLNYQTDPYDSRGTTRTRK